MKTFNAELSQYESDPKKLEEDRVINHTIINIIYFYYSQIKREKALEETIKAKKEKGEEKERLLQEQKDREKKMKEEFSKWKQPEEEKKGDKTD